MKNNFEGLTLKERAVILRERGSAITRRRQRHYFITLCALDGDYVEMWYHTFEKRIHKIEILKEPDGLDLYLDQIQLCGVYEMLLNPDTLEKHTTEISKDEKLEQDSNEEVHTKPFIRPSILSVVKWVFYMAIFFGSPPFSHPGKYESESVDKNSRESTGRSETIADHPNLSYFFSNVKAEGDSLR